MQTQILESWQIALLGLIQGAAELLPVSSSAHVIFAQKMMGLDPSQPQMTFLLVMLHTGTMCAVLVFFWKRWAQILREGGRQFLWSLFLATGCTGALGLTLKFLIERVVFEKLLGHAHGEVETLFKSLPAIGGALFAAGSLIFVSGSERFRKRKVTLDPLGKDLKKVSVGIGLVQGVCLPFRGFSRSGATISVGLMLGLKRAWAEDFSFALAVLVTPPVIVQQLFRFSKHGVAIEWSTLSPGLFGFVCAAVSGFVALKFLSSVLESGRWRYFSYYCFFFAGVLWTAASLGV